MAFVSFDRAMQDPAFLGAAKAAGLRGETTWRRRAIKEAQGNHTWAKYGPSAPRVTGELKINVATAKLALS